MPPHTDDADRRQAHLDASRIGTPAGAPDAASARFRALGTTAVVLCRRSEHTATAEAAVRRCVQEIDRTASRFRPDSELSRLNAAAGHWVAVSPLLLDEITVALDAAELTDGAVDPTVGRALRVLGYDRSFDLLAADGPAVIRVGAVAGWRAVRVDRRRSAVHVPGGVQLDLGATAKARCADRAAAAAVAELRRLGGAGPVGVLVSLGGDVATAGDAPEDGWPVLVAERHDAPLDGPGPVVQVHAGGVATSSVTVRHWRRGHRTVHHLIDPATGREAPVIWRTASVAAAGCTAANIASTASIVLGASAPDWLARHRLPARLVAADGGVRTCNGWPGDGEERP